MVKLIPLQELLQLMKLIEEELLTLDFLLVAPFLEDVWADRLQMQIVDRQRGWSARRA